MKNPDSWSNTAGGRIEALARGKFADLLPAEVRLIWAAATTKRAALGPSENLWEPANNPEFSETGNPEKSVPRWGAEREVRADVIRWLCIDTEASKLVDPRGIQLFGARVTGELDLLHTCVPFPLSMVHCRIVGALFLNGCQIPRLDLDGSWTGAISADGANVKQSIYLRGVRAHGMISLNLAQIGGTLTCEEGVFHGVDGVAIWADGIKVKGDVLFRADSQRSGKLMPFRAHGGVRLVGAEIDGDLDCRGGEFLNKDGDGILMERAVIHGEIFFGAGFKVEGHVNLENTVAMALEDDETCWPVAGKLKLNGFVYTSIEPKDVKSRLLWLKLDASDATQPYRQLAKVLQESGDAKKAKCVLIEMEKKIASKGRLRWLKAIIGYGYSPGNAIWLLVGLWLTGSLLYFQSYRAGSIVPTDKDAYTAFQLKRQAPAYYPRFVAAAFSLENTFPLVKLGQADKWQADSQSYLRWFMWIQILLGWLFATLFVAAVAGIVQHG
jgi:hypothetical protein